LYRADSQRDDNYAHSIVSRKIELVIELIFKIIVRREESELEAKRSYKCTDIYNFNCNVHTYTYIYIYIYIYIKYLIFI